MLLVLLLEVWWLNGELWRCGYHRNRPDRRADERSFVVIEKSKRYLEWCVT